MKSVIVERQKLTKTRPSAKSRVGPFRSAKKSTQDASKTQESTKNLAYYTSSAVRPFASNESKALRINQIAVSPTLAEDERLAKLKQLRRCQHCHWPRAGSHLDRLDSIQLIQLKWMRDNLMTDFERNIDEIQDRAFKHRLWSVFLEALLKRKDIANFIICCAMLDDIRLIKLPRLIEQYDTQLVIDCILDTLSKSVEGKQGDICRKCQGDLESLDGLRDELLVVTELDSNKEAEIKFNLVNLLNLSLTAEFRHLKLLIKSLNQRPALLTSSQVPVTFYSRALSKLINTCT